jgi:alpha-aminoadipate carrier protein LysW
MDNRKVTVKCPVCDNDFELDLNGIQVGDIIECPVCGATLEVLSLDPIKLEAVVRGK